jgi:hypothetical protein
MHVALSMAIDRRKPGLGDLVQHFRTMADGHVALWRWPEVRSMRTSDSLRHGASR